jgi:hypothetical protein
MEGFFKNFFLLDGKEELAHGPCRLLTDSKHTLIAFHSFITNSNLPSTDRCGHQIKSVDPTYSVPKRIVLDFE